MHFLQLTQNRGAQGKRQKITFYALSTFPWNVRHFDVTSSKMRAQKKQDVSFDSHNSLQH